MSSGDVGRKAEREQISAVRFRKELRDFRGEREPGKGKGREEGKKKREVQKI